MFEVVVVSERVLGLEDPVADGAGVAGALHVKGLNKQYLKVKN